MILYYIAKFLLYLPWKLLYPIRIIGKQNIPKKGGAVAVCNHYTNPDPLHIAINLPRKFDFMGKKELFKNRFINKVFRYLGGIPVDRERPDMSTVKTCVFALKKGRMLLLFPEGKRNKTEAELLPLKRGMSFFALLAKVPIVPMMFYEKPKLFRKNYLIVGEPVYLTEYYGRKNSEIELDELDQKLRSVMIDLKGRVPEKFALKQAQRKLRIQSNENDSPNKDKD